MGTCVSVQKSPSDSAGRVRWSICFKDESEAFSKKANVTGQYLDGEAAGGKEVFFDSHAWLDSDCEDFFSTNGDNTPSLRSSPVHQLSHGDQKKKLSELFCESFGSDKVDGSTSFRDGSEQETATPPPTIVKMSKSTNEAMLQRRKSSSRGVGRCLPGLIRSLSCSDWKKRLSPAHVAQG
ncbi:hypothetical protein Ancab_021366 [Ancistrocladus abbreviatus]